jgi:hypothetical protein
MAVRNPGVTIVVTKLMRWAVANEQAYEPTLTSAGDDRNTHIRSAYPQIQPRKHEMIASERLSIDGIPAIKVDS